MGQSITVLRGLPTDSENLAELALALYFNARVACDTGDMSSAEALAYESVELYLELASELGSPSPMLISALECRSEACFKLGRPRSALEQIDQAIGWLRSDTQPSPHKEQCLASLLLTRSFTLEKSGDLKGAFDAVLDADEIHRKLVSTGDVHPDSSKVADLMFRKGSLLSVLHRPSEALEPARRAVEIRRQDLLAIGRESHPEQIERLRCMCTACHLLANINIQLHDTNAGLAVTKSGLKYAERLVELDPTRVSNLASLLFTAAILTRDAGDPERALKLCRRSAALVKGRLAKEPYLRGFFAMLVADMSFYEHEIGNRTGALTLSQEAIVLYYDFIQDYPAEFRPDFGLTLHKNYTSAVEEAPMTSKRDLTAKAAIAAEALGRLLVAR